MRRTVVIWLATILVLGTSGIVQGSAAIPRAAEPAAADAAAPLSPTDETKIPHYFGPYPNWANSPQTLADAIVTITAQAGDAGTGAEATATVDPKTGGITAITVTSPGTGYGVQPSVSIDAPGITPTAPAGATAQISLGVVTSIAVVESGFGFTTPTVSLTGGNPTPGSEATAAASGGVDNITLTDPGSGYAIQPIVEFSLPQLTGGVPATGSATMNGSGVVTAIDVVNPGSGYTSAPTVTILDGNQPNPTAATAVATIGIGQIDVTSGGQGYDSAPAVTIADSVAPFDKGASATAAVAVRGAVTGITVTAAGAGYLTPGLKKFVDTLPGLTPAGANDLGQYIPVGVPDTTTYPGSDYYEIAVVQYRMKFHRDLPATLLRGYVQLSTSVVPGNQVPLSNANLDPTLPSTPIVGYTGVDNPHYLGPTIVATKDRPVRILFRNLLPTGVGGDLFLPVDTSLMGSGPGPGMMTLDSNGVPMDMSPDLGTVTDGVRNPICGETPKPMECYSENRATLHLHGGITPWISDGTPHQWTTPDGEDTAYPQGVSVSNVPDMPDPGPGALTFFYTNQQSARLMFYHDHAWGITRLNVYAGEAAAYLITDAMEQSLVAPGGALDGLGIGTPLVIQDKTFVPSTAQMQKTDPTWDASRWGGEGSLWTPHVYMPAQNPGDPTGMSAFGRWMYGPWFWPPAGNAKYPPIANPYYDPTCDPNVQPFCEPQLIPSTPNISVGMEAFNDTPIVNGTAYPTTTVDPKAYRYRILNAANDRFWNLQWYVADPTTGTLSEVALKPAELAAAQTDPNVFPTPDTTKSPAGPNWIQIGTEGGFLPSPAVIPAQPITWITDPTRFDFGNADKHSLLLAPAERADVIVDFSQFRGKTLILYNDAPAAFPARVSSYDYYTGGPDLSPVGAPTTLPGYGPNTRTIMQVKVSNAPPATAWDRPNTTNDRMGTLMAAFAHHLDASGNPAGVFESGSDPIVVGQAAYNSAYGSSFVTNGWCNSPTNPSAKCDGFARIQEQGGDLFGFNTLAAPTAKMQIPLRSVAMHDEMNSANFDEWGRMTANLGVEAPGATPLLQNIILFPYVNPATETFDSTGLPSSLDVTPIASAADGTQIWKITHNGVDTHPIHWHLYDVQVINRVTWDNIIMPPDANELGWKDTVRISPLEDTYVAVRPIVPTLPFAVPDSRRPLNPMMPLGAQGSANGPNGTEAGFNNTDIAGNPIAPIVNEIVNFGWEYVFHCHILSHEEMDMMRPVTVHVSWTVPDAPILTHPLGGPIVLNWTDGTPVDYTNPATWANPKEEIGYKILRATVAGGVPGAFSEVGKALANQTSYTDASALPGNEYQYEVVAYNEAGASTSNAVTAVVGLNITASSATMVYGGTVPTITPIYAPTLNPPTIPAPAVLPTCSTTATSTSPVGTYPSSCTGPATDPVYQTINYFAGTVTVTPAPVIVTAPSPTVAYGDPVPALTPAYAGLVAPTTVPTTPALCQTTYGVGSPVGTYSVTCSGAADTNYTFSYVAGVLTVGPAVLTVTAPSPSMVYGAAVPPLVPSITGFVGTDTLASLTTAPTCTTTATGASPVGTYPVTCSGGAAANYTFNYVAGTLTVTPAVVSVTASSPSMVYGGAVPLITPIYSGFLNGATAPATAPTCSTTALSTSPVGTYPSSCSGAADPNYTFTYTPGLVTVTPATVVVTASNGTMIYGGTPPAITPSYAGFLNGATAPATAPTCSTTALSTSAVGIYLSTCSGAADTNYTFSYVAGIVSVTRATLTVTASNATMAYGAAVPAITPSYAGFVNGNTPASLTTAPTCSTTATSASPVGTYPTTCLGAASPNYTFNYVAGTLTVIKANQTITFGALGNKTLGVNPFLVTATASSGLPVAFFEQHPDDLLGRRRDGGGPRRRHLHDRGVTARQHQLQRRPECHTVVLRGEGRDDHDSHRQLQPDGAQPSGDLHRGRRTDQPGRGRDAHR